MEIVKHGNKWQLKDGKYCCEDCGCVFKYSQTDCYVEFVLLKDDKQEVKEANDLIFAMLQIVPTKNAKFWYVNCPECGKKIRLEEVKDE